MLKRQKNSAKFKKDYIAYLAIFLFFMVVCSEITIAIWLPMQMRSTWIGAKAMAEQRMIDIFDHTRRRYHSALNKKIDKNAENEMQIIKGVLDYNARFLRESPISIRNRLSSFMMIMSPFCCKTKFICMKIIRIKLITVSVKRLIRQLL